MAKKTFHSKDGRWGPDKINAFDIFLFYDSLFYLLLSLSYFIFSIMLMIFLSFSLPSLVSSFSTLLRASLFYHLFLAMFLSSFVVRYFVLDVPQNYFHFIEITTNNQPIKNNPSWTIRIIQTDFWITEEFFLFYCPGERGALIETCLHIPTVKSLGIKGIKSLENVAHH